MTVLLIVGGALVLLLIVCLIIATNTCDKNTYGFPYPPSKEFLEKYKEEQKIRQEIVREHGIGALNTYLKINNPRKK